MDREDRLYLAEKLLDKTFEQLGQAFGLTESYDSWGAFDTAFPGDQWADTGRYYYTPPTYRRSYGRGEKIPVYISEQQLRLIRDQSRILAATNEWALCATGNRKNYAVGENGLIVRAVARKGFDPSKDLLRKVQFVVDACVGHNALGELQREMVERLDRDGEVFIRSFPQPDGLLLFRAVEPEWVRSPSGDTDIENSFGVQTKAGDIETPTGYWIVPDPWSNQFPELVPASEVLHIKANCDRNSKRGVPIWFAVGGTLMRAENLLRGICTMADVRARFAVIRRLKGVAKSVAEQFLANMSDGTTTDPNPANNSPREANIERVPMGSVMTANDQVEYEFPAANVAAGELVEVLNAVLRAVAARMRMPEWMLTTDTGSTNYASALVSEAPSVKEFQAFQWIFKAAVAESPWKNHRQSLLWRQIAYAVELGVLPSEVFHQVDLQAEAPSLVVRDKAGEANTNKTYLELGIKSPQTICSEQGLDFDQETENLKKAQEMGWNPPGGGGQGQGPGDDPQGPGGQGGGPELASLMQPDQGEDRPAGVTESAGKDEGLEAPTGEDEVNALIELLRVSKEIMPYCALTESAGHFKRFAEIVTQAEKVLLEAGRPSPRLAPLLESGDEEADDDLGERAQLIAEFLFHLYGEDAVKHLAELEESVGRIELANGLVLLEGWNAADHPRGKGGRFIPRGSAEAVSAAKETVDKVLKGQGGDAKQVADHLAILTVKQLRELHQSNGVKKIPKEILRQQLVDAVLEKITPAGSKKEEKPEEKAPEKAGAAAAVDPLSITPDNVKDHWEKARDEIISHDPKLSPNAAGAIAAARVMNAVDDAAAKHIAATDAKVKNGEPITDEEDEKYIAAQDLRKRLYKPLVDLSGYRPGSGAEDHPYAKEPLDSSMFVDNASAQAEKTSKLNAKAEEVKARAEEAKENKLAKSLNLEPIKGRIEWDGSLHEDPQGGKTLYRSADGELHRSASDYKKKQTEKQQKAKAEEDKARADEQAIQQKQAKEKQDQESYQRTKSNMEAVEKHASEAIKRELKAAGYGDAAKRLKVKGIGNLALPDDSPKEAIEIRNKIIDRYSKAGIDPYRDSPEEIQAKLAGLSGQGQTPASAPDAEPREKMDLADLANEPAPEPAPQEPTSGALMDPTFSQAADPNDTAMRSFPATNPTTKATDSKSLAAEVAEGPVTSVEGLQAVYGDKAGEVLAHLAENGKVTVFSDTDLEQARAKGQAHIESGTRGISSFSPTGSLTAEDFDAAAKAVGAETAKQEPATTSSWSGPPLLKPGHKESNWRAAQMTREDYAKHFQNNASNVNVDPKGGVAGFISGSRDLIAPSRGKKAWLAKLGGESKKFGRQRSFVAPSAVNKSGMNKQKIEYVWSNLEPGEYEISGDEFGEYRHTFKVYSPEERHKELVERAIAEGFPVHPDVLADYQDLVADQAKKAKTASKNESKESKESPKNRPIAKFSVDSSGLIKTGVEEADKEINAAKTYPDAVRAIVKSAKHFSGSEGGEEAVVASLNHVAPKVPQFVLEKIAKENGINPGSNPIQAIISHISSTIK